MAKLSGVNAALTSAVRSLNLGDPNNIRRIVIDLHARKEPTVYVECYADPEGTIEVVQALSTVTVGMVLRGETKENEEVANNG